MDSAISWAGASPGSPSGGDSIGVSICCVIGGFSTLENPLQDAKKANDINKIRQKETLIGALLSIAIKISIIRENV